MPLSEDKDRFDEIFSNDRIMQSVFVHDGDERETVHKHPHPYPRAGVFDAFISINHDPRHSARRRPALEDIPAEVLTFQFPEPFFTPAEYAVGVIRHGSDCHEPWVFRIAGETHGFTRHRQSAFNLRADGNVFEKTAEGIPDKRVELMATVVPDFFTEQAGAYTDSYFFVVSRHSSPITIDRFQVSLQCAFINRSATGSP